MTTPTTSQRQRAAAATSTGASGVVRFAAVMLLVLGALQVLQGLTAVFGDDLFVKTDHYIYSFNLTSWGWIHLGLGALAIAVALGLFAQNAWAAVGGVGLASLSAIANFLFLPYYPLWSTIVIGFDVFVIWALCVQLGEYGDY